MVGASPTEARLGTIVALAAFALRFASTSMQGSAKATTKKVGVFTFQQLAEHFCPIEISKIVVFVQAISGDAACAMRSANAAATVSGAQTRRAFSVDSATAIHRLKEHALGAAVDRRRLVGSSNGNSSRRRAQDEQRKGPKSKVHGLIRLSFCGHTKELVLLQPADKWGENSEQVLASSVSL